MDPKNQQQNNQQDVQSQQPGVGVPLSGGQSQSQSQPQQAQTPQPVSGPAKEHAPIETAPSEYMQPTERMPELHPIVKEAGVEQSPDTERVQLTSEQLQAGVNHAKDALAHPTEPSGSVQLPMTQTQVIESKKADTVTNPKRWLAELTEYVMKKLQMQKDTK
jgi:hypothetical protein